MYGDRKVRSPRGLLGVLGLLLLIAAMLPLSTFLAGLLPGGGDLPPSAQEPGREPEPGTLRITVVSRSERDPVEGATILVQGLAGGETRAESDAQGRVVFEGLGAGPVRVQASFQGHTVAVWTDPILSGEIQLAVGEQEMRTGSVRFRDGTALEGVVQLLDEHGNELASTKTDEAGRYVLPDLPDAVAVCALAPGLPATSVSSGDVVVEEGVWVQGALGGASGGELVVYGLQPSPRADGVLPLRVRWPVSPRGGFRGQLSDGTQAWALYDGLPLRVENGDIRLPGRATATGRVMRNDGLPALQAQLVFRPQLDGDFAAPLPGVKVSADEKGAFSAEGFARVRYSVVARARGCATRVVPDVVPGGEPIEIVLEPGYALHGIVRDTNGLPIIGARVQAAGFPHDDAAHPIARVHTDERGRFELNGLAGEHARMRITAPGFHATTLEQVKPGSNSRVVLQRK